MFGSEVYFMGCEIEFTWKAASQSKEGRNSTSTGKAHAGPMPPKYGSLLTHVLPRFLRAAAGVRERFDQQCDWSSSASRRLRVDRVSDCGRDYAIGLLTRKITAH